VREYMQHRVDVLKGAQFRRTVLGVQKLIDGRFESALIGGLAVAYYANPPVTVDADFLADVDEDVFNNFRADMVRARWGAMPLAFTTRRAGYPQRGFAFERMLPDMAKYERADFLFAGEDTYLQSVVRRGKLVTIQGARLRVARPEDIIVLKTLSGRDKDIEDVFALMRAVKVDQRYIDNLVERFL